MAALTGLLGDYGSDDESVATDREEGSYGVKLAYVCN